MQYRRLGRSGLQVSELSFGSWVTYSNQVDTKLAQTLMKTAYDAGVNFFDNAEVYAGSKSETIMGEAIQALGLPRLSYVVSSKYFWGLGGDQAPVNGRNTLNRKYLLQAVEGSLKRFKLEFIDIVYCHRPDPNTPVEETVWALHDLISQGKVLYWGTSEWSADEIRAAHAAAEKYGLRAPVVEQPEYNLFHRKRVEEEYARLYEDVGLGLTTWSPLASGLLTGKYKQGIPENARANLPGYGFLRDHVTDKAKNEAVAELERIARDLGGSVAQLAIAWANKNPRVSSVILGASKLSQLEENLKALELTPKLTPEVIAAVELLTQPLSD